MKKNVASQVVGAQMVSATDGSAFTGSATVVVTVDGGTQSASGGTGPTHEGNGFHSYLPTQAETNGDHVAFTFTGSGAVPVTVQIYTTFPQTGDNYARIGAPTGASIAADIGTAQADLDTLTGSDGVTLATAQGNYAPAKAGDSMALTAAAVDAVWDETMTAHATADSAAVHLKDTLADTADMQPKLGTPAADVSADIAAVKAETASIVADTNELQTDDVPGLIAALDVVVDRVEADTQDLQTQIGTAGAGLTAIPEVSADVTKISGSATAADNLEASALGIVTAAVNDASATTTTFIADGFTEATDDHFNGRIIVFTSGALANQATDITDYTGSTQTFTVTALTEAPGNNDTFVIV